MSVLSISKAKSCSINKVIYWLDKFEIPRRNRQEASYIQHNPKGDPFRIKPLIRAGDKALYYMALGIYWGEGNKANKHALRVGNTDPNMILVFTKFLREICNVEETKIRFGLQLFNDVDEEEAVNYWMNKLKINRDQIMPTISRIKSGKIGTYKNKNTYGVMTVQVNNYKLRNWMIEQLKMPT